MRPPLALVKEARERTGRPLVQCKAALVAAACDIDRACAALQQPTNGVAGGRVPVRTEYTGISEHSSTRVHAAPGGKSSISLG